MVVIGDCQRCNGTAELPHPSAGETVTCFVCNGFGRTKDRWGQGYKTQAMANKHGKAVCRKCKGSGKYTFDMTVKCYSCDGGKTVVDANAGDILPESINHCESASRDIAAKLAEQIRFVVVRNSNGLNWGESYLGLGAIRTVTDYGRAWGMNDEDILAMVKSEFANDRMQWIHLIDKQSRKIAEVIGIKVTPNGYSVVSVGSLQSNPALPPTYTNAVLSRSI